MAAILSCPYYIKSVLDQVMAWRWRDGKPWPELQMTQVTDTILRYLPSIFTSNVWVTLQFIVHLNIRQLLTQQYIFIGYDRVTGAFRAKCHVHVKWYKRQWKMRLATKSIPGFLVRCIVNVDDFAIINTQFSQITLDRGQLNNYNVVVSFLLHSFKPVSIW